MRVALRALVLFELPRLHRKVPELFRRQEERLHALALSAATQVVARMTQLGQDEPEKTFSVPFENAAAALSVVAGAFVFQAGAARRTHAGLHEAHVRPAMPELQASMLSEVLVDIVQARSPPPSGQIHEIMHRSLFRA